MKKGRLMILFGILGLTISCVTWTILVSNIIVRWSDTYSYTYTYFLYTLFSFGDRFDVAGPWGNRLGTIFISPIFSIMLYGSVLFLIIGYIRSSSETHSPERSMTVDSQSSDRTVHQEASTMQQKPDQNQEKPPSVIQVCFGVLVIGFVLNYFIQAPLIIATVSILFCILAAVGAHLEKSEQSTGKPQKPGNAAKPSQGNSQSKEFKSLAEQGNATAQYELGVMYHNGRGVPQDYAEAVNWYRKAADQGYATAQNNLGVMYRTGKGVPQDNAEAVNWYRKAAEQGLALAQYNLGVMYDNGLIGPQDVVQAYMWLNLAAVQNYTNAQKSRDLLAKKMTPSQIAEAQRLAREWKPKGSDVKAQRKAA